MLTYDTPTFIVTVGVEVVSNVTQAPQLSWNVPEHDEEPGMRPLWRQVPCEMKGRSKTATKWRW